jgi:hypothetical protein
MSKQTTAAAHAAARAACGRRDPAPIAPGAHGTAAHDNRAHETAPTVQALEEENLGLRNTVVDLVLQVVILRESLPAGFSRDVGPGRIGGVRTASHARRRS